jgi:hypothetical protein
MKFRQPAPAGRSRQLFPSSHLASRMQCMMTADRQKYIRNRSCSSALCTPHSALRTMQPARCKASPLQDCRRPSAGQAGETGVRLRAPPRRPVCLKQRLTAPRRAAYRSASQQRSQVTRGRNALAGGRKSRVYLMLTRGRDKI